MIIVLALTIPAALIIWGVSSWILKRKRKGAQ